MEGIKDILQGMLDEIVEKYKNEYKTAFEILQKLISNIINSPENQKFRVIKKTNPIVQTKLLQIPQIVDVLNVIGFEDGTGEKENCFVFEGETFDPLKECNELLGKYLSDNDGFKVMVYQYDISQGLARTMSQTFLGKQIEGVWHTAVCVYGKEYFYGGGICVGEPKKTPYGYPVKEIDFGFTKKTQNELQDFIKTINSKFTMNTYNVLNNNCNHFTDAALFFLVGKHLPDPILKQHEEILSTPMGQMLRPMLENLSNQNNAFLPNMFEGNNNYNNNGARGNYMQ